MAKKYLQNGNAVGTKLSQKSIKRVSHKRPLAHGENSTRSLLTKLKGSVIKRQTDLEAHWLAGA